MNRLVSTLHDATHRVPGVPDHRENQRPQHPNPRLRNSTPHAQKSERHHRVPRHHQAPPRVLIAWQNWIGQLVRRDGSR